MASIWRELKRRDVVRVATAYAIVSWLILQFTDVLISLLSLPDSIGRLAFVLVLIGFPVTLILAWVFELTPDGVKKTADVEEEISSAPASRHKVNYVIAGALLSALGFIAWEQLGSVRAPDEVVAADAAKTIAVLPFISMSSDREQKWFADGLTEEILNSLAKTADLLVTARTSSFAFRDSQDDVPTIAAALGVDHILEGSVRRGGDRLRITAQLIRAKDGFHIWSETYDKTPDNIIAIQEEIAIAIATALETAMDPEALAEMMSAGTRSVPAYEAYLTGSGAWIASAGDIKLRLVARAAFEKAVALDPDFTKAYDLLFWFWRAQLQTNNLSYGLTELTEEEIVKKTVEAVNNAIRSEKNISFRLKYQAHKAWVEMQPKRALRLITEFLEQNPNVETGRSMRGLLWSYLNMQDELDEMVETRYDHNDLKAGQAQRWLGALEFSGNENLMRTLAYDAIESERFGGYPPILYRAHHVLLNAGDVDGARAIMPDLVSIYAGKRRQYLVELRQACAELRITDAEQIQAKALQQMPDDLAMKWLSNKIMGDDEVANDLFREFDDKGEIRMMFSYLLYPNFDAKLYPNFMRAMAGQGVAERQIVELPYRCNR